MFGMDSWPAGWLLGNDGFTCPWCAWEGHEELDPRLHPDKWTVRNLARYSLTAGEN